MKFFVNCQNIKKFPTQRNSALELLRIIAMFIIIIHHFGVHGINPYFEKLLNANWTLYDVPWQYIFTQFMCWGGNLGNSIFILITGYFLIDRKVNYKKILLLLSTLFFYSWIIMIFLYGGHFMPFSLKGMLKSLIPIWFGSNWFVSCYIIFSFFIPFFNTLLNTLSYRRYSIFIGMYYVIFFILPAFSFVNFMSQSRFLFFAFVYALGGYLRLYDKTLLSMKRKYLIQSLTYFFFIFLIIACSFFYGSYVHKISLIERIPTNTTFLQVLLAVSLFRLFLSLPPFYSRFINKLAKTLLGIYLIHDNNIMRPFLWHSLFPNIDFLYSDWYCVFYILKVLIVFIICAIIELIRKKFLEFTISHIIDKYYDVGCKYGRRIVNYFI